MGIQKTLIGIGNAAIDAMIELSSETDIAKYNLEKGGCVFVGNDDPVMAQILSNYPNHFLDAGGAAANALCAYGALGGLARLIAKTGMDAHGDFFKSETRKCGVVHDTSPSAINPSTFLIAAITPDRERSFLSNHGASHDISADDVNAEWFTPTTSLIIDGYMIMSGGGPDAMLTAMEYAKNKGSEIIFMPCSLSVIDHNRALIDDITNKANAIICNEDEAIALANTTDIDQALNRLQHSGDYDWGVVTLGREGAFYFNGDMSETVPIPHTPATITNTNGAGDNFSGGLIYGLHHGLTMREAVVLGQKCAIHVLGRKSARCAIDMKDQIQ
jgi:sugar/nucleoside kinase (ribokinase family)